MKAIKRNAVIISCLLGLPIVGQLKGDPISKSPSDEALEAEISTGLRNLGVEGKYEIVVAEERDIVEDTAACEIQRFLAKASIAAPIVRESEVTGERQIILGRESNLPILRSLESQGIVNLRSISPLDDGFHLVRSGNKIIIAGSNPRGVLYGAYEFEHIVNSGGSGKLNVRKIPFYRERGGALCFTENFFHPELTESFTEDKVAYLARLGINQLTDQGIGGSLIDFVSSDVFPFQKPPLPDYQRKVKALSALCKKYGIDMYLFLMEPGLPARSADLAQYPKEALGTVRRPWGGNKDHLDTTLCVSSPLVQENLRGMMKKLVLEYPDVKGVLFYNMDVSSWLCTPDLCDRCKAVCTDSPGGLFNPWETQARLVTLLSQTAHDARPNFDFRFWGAIHFHGGAFVKLLNAAQGYNSLLSSWTASDRTLMVPDAAQRDPAFIASQQMSEKRNIPLYMAFEANNLEAVPYSLPFPFHVSDALKKYKRWGVRNLTEIFGAVPDHNPINALVTKAFEAEPDIDPRLFLSDLAQRQFGKASGKWMYRSWEEMKLAFDVWNDFDTGPFPLEGSETELTIAVGSSGLGAPPPAILPDVVKNYDAHIQILCNVEPWLTERYQKFKSEEMLTRMSSMGDHLSKAADLAKKAVGESSESEFIEDCLYATSSGRPTRREYCEENYAPIAIANAICKQQCNKLRAYRLLREIDSARSRHDDKVAAESESSYRELIRYDIGVQNEFCDLLLGFAKMTPCYTRTTLTDKEIAQLLLKTHEKIDLLNHFLSTKVSVRPSTPL